MNHALNILLIYYIITVIDLTIIDIIMMMTVIDIIISRIDLL